MGIGAEIASLSSPIINEGPVFEFKADNFVPVATNPLNELNAQDAVLEAETILAETARPLIGIVDIPDVFRSSLFDINLNPDLQPEAILQSEQYFRGVAESSGSYFPGEITEPKIIREAVYWFADVAAPVVKPAEVIISAGNWQEYQTPQSVIKPQVATFGALNIQADPRSKTESRTSYNPATLIQPQIVLREEEIEKVVEEQVATKNQVAEEVGVETRTYLEDEEVSKTRRFEIKEAVTKAKVEANRLGLKKITGWLVAKFLPAEHLGNRSQVIKETGPDGSYQETKESIVLSGEFSSEYEAIAKGDEIVREKKPVRFGKEGKKVSIKDVARVFKNRMFKDAGNHVEVVKRILKKKVQVPEQLQPVKREKRIEDYPVLAEVFQKAA